MDTMKIISALALFFSLLTACREEVPESADPPGDISAETEKSVAEIRDELQSKGYKTFDYVDEATRDTILMQQYFMAFLKTGTESSGTKAESDSLQALHLAHLSRMYEEGYADISGPFGDDGVIRGVTIYNTPDMKTADSLAHLDPLVKAGILEVEIHPWWAAKGFPLR